MGRIVRLEGDVDDYEVLAETAEHKFLVNRSGRLRQRRQDLERELATVDAQLAGPGSNTDVSRNAITGP